ncbi:MAG: ComEC/Rec2-related protein [Verrucomicrobiales bacterium]|jgi:ComEC/Rec2-related protein
MSESEPGAVDRPSNVGRDVSILLAVGAAFMAARLLTTVPLTVAIIALILAAASLRPRFVLIAVLLLIGARAGSAVGALEPVETRPVLNETVRLVDDPRPDGVSWRAIGVISGERVLLSARNPQAGSLRTGAAGDELSIRGTLRGMTPESSWAISRRIVGRMTVTDARIESRASGPRGMATSMRSLVREGAASLSRDRRVLFTGLVFGDDRGQNVIVADNFRAAGLGHLLAVSGQNVVFVLILAAPFLTRLRKIPIRVFASFVVLAAFGFLTRFEPSVTRALVMVGLALLAQAMGRPGGAASALPPTVIGLLLFDPLLAWSLAFQLSVCATAGLIVLAPRIADRLAGPAALRLAIAATIAAQAFVAPLLLSTFGQVSIVAVPANLVAAPAAAGVMMWGLLVGPIAGLAPPEVATFLHLPTRALLWWIDGVAAIASRVDIGEATSWHLGAIALGGVSWNVRKRLFLLPASVTAALIAGGLGMPIIIPNELPAGRHVAVDGVEIVRSSAGTDLVLLSGSAREAETIEALRRARLGRIDLLIAVDGSRSTGRLVRLVDQRFEIVDVWAPDGHEVPGARTVSPMEGVVGSLRIIGTGEGLIILESE